MGINNLFIVNLFRDIIHLPVWYLQKKNKRNPNLWIFGSWVGNSYSDNSKIVYEYVIENCKDIKAVWLTNSPAVYSKLSESGKSVAMINSKKGIDYCKKAGYAFLTQSPRDVNHWYINGIKQIWLWHGMPLKKVGFDHHVYKNAIKDRIRELFPFNNHAKSDNPYFFVSISDKWNSAFKTAFHINEDKILISGLPRNDTFFEKSEESLITNINHSFGNPVKVLYMPTFRDYSQLYGKEPFNPFGGFGFDSNEFKKLLENENLFFMYKGHYVDLKISKLKQDFGNRFLVLDDSMYNDMYSLIKDADILITDYSSVYFDFLLLKKPVILAPFDYKDYIANSRDFYFDYDKTIEGVRAYNWNELLQIIRDKKYYFPVNALNALHLYKDGLSTKRVVETVIKDSATINS